MNILKTYNLNGLELKNRIVMAPMTRCRAINNVPNDLMATYYGQRANAGLIISEGTSPSINGLGYARIPGAYSPSQIQGWKKIANAVHENDGKIFVQLMHCGRISTKENLPDTADTIAPSAVKSAGEMYTDSKGMQPHDTPFAMTEDDLVLTRKDFVNASKLLIEEAGIDGIELHAANGYLLDQFLNPKSNLRSDEYGGDFKNRARYVVEVVNKVVSTIGADRVGIRFSPYGGMNDVEHNYPDLVEMYTYLAEELKKIGIAYIHIADHTGTMGAPEFKSAIVKTMKFVFKGTIITGGDVDTLEKAETVLNNGADLTYIGRPYVSNPNLIEKLQNNKPLTPANQELFYSAGAEGYTDY